MTSGVIQFSPVRTGSTLIYNFLREILVGTMDSKQDLHLEKLHSLSPDLLLSRNKQRIVSTIRHPFDSILSLGTLEPSRTLESLLELYLEQGAKSFVLLMETKSRNHLVLRYEDFYDKYEVVFAALESFFKFALTGEVRQRLTHKYQRSAVRSLMAVYPDFSGYDPKTHFHGQHISMTDGRSTYRHRLTLAQRMQLAQDPVVAAIMKKYNYSLY